jgi:hypothetical protein
VTANQTNSLINNATLFSLLTQNTNRMKAIHAYLLTASFAITHFLHAQTNGLENPGGLRLGVHGGTMVYRGDLSNNFFGSFDALHPAFGVNLTKSISPYLSARLDFSVGRLSSNEANQSTPSWKKFRNFSFSTPVTELALSLQWNILGDYNTNAISAVSPYVFVGASVNFLNIERNWRNIDTSAFDSKSNVLQGLGADTLTALPSTLFMLPVGAGISAQLSNTISIYGEASFRLGFSDYLDGFSAAANPKQNDNYYSAVLGLRFQLGGGGGSSKYGCPKWQSKFEY